MTEKLLYFPYINVPKTSWTIQSLLYWNEVGVITPQIYIENPGRFDNYNKHLLQSDLIRQIIPYNYVQKAPNFDKGFIELIDGKGFNLRRRIKYFKLGSLTKIHVQKFGKHLLDHLVKSRIANQINYEWYEVEFQTAEEIMYYLATIIGKIGDYVPATDNLLYLDNFKKFQQINIRQRILDGVMPFPKIPDLTSLRRFKDRHHEELRSFRILVEQSVINLINIRSTEYREAGILLKIDEINDRKQKLVSDMNSTPGLGQVLFGSIFGIVGAIHGYTQDNTPEAIFSLVNAIHSGLQGYNKAHLLKMDYSYLALIESKL